ncbi:hypothetical protein KFE25_004475 [Diacronema lutheri]|uniref:F-box domain-containing protein n=1 Tax=Diacronema lutheri TaxID=2081491 RepID=A0A8J5XB65_DIALT|nr:hypothetical protein KFE25_004475 [Diacronema lutheri]
MALGGELGGEDVLLLVLSQLEPLRDLARCAQVCVTWRAACASPLIRLRALDAATATLLPRVDAAAAAAAEPRADGAGMDATLVAAALPPAAAFGGDARAVPRLLRPGSAAAHRRADAARLALDLGALELLGGALALAARLVHPPLAAAPPACVGALGCTPSAAERAAQLLAGGGGGGGSGGGGERADARGARVVALAALCIAVETLRAPEQPPTAEHAFIRARAADGGELHAAVAKQLAACALDSPPVRAEVSAQAARHLAAHLRRAWATQPPRARAPFLRAAAAADRRHARALAGVDAARAHARALGGAMAAAGALAPGAHDWAVLALAHPALAALCRAASARAAPPAEPLASGRGARVGAAAGGGGGGRSGGGGDVEWAVTLSPAGACRRHSLAPTGGAPARLLATLAAPAPRPVTAAPLAPRAVEAAALGASGTRAPRAATARASAGGGHGDGGAPPLLAAGRVDTPRSPAAGKTQHRPPAPRAGGSTGAGAGAGARVPTIVWPHEAPAPNCAAAGPPPRSAAAVDELAVSPRGAGGGRRAPRPGAAPVAARRAESDAATAAAARAAAAAEVDAQVARLDERVRALLARTPPPV